MAKDKITPPDAPTITLNLQLTLTRVIGERKYLARLFGQDGDQDLLLQKCFRGPIVEFKVDGQPYQFNVREVVDQAEGHLSVDRPNRIGDSSGARA